MWHRPTPHLTVGPHTGMGHPKHSQQRGGQCKTLKQHTSRRQAAGTPLCTAFPSQKWVKHQK